MKPGWTGGGAGGATGTGGGAGGATYAGRGGAAGVPIAWAKTRPPAAPSGDVPATPPTLNVSTHENSPRPLPLYLCGNQNFTARSCWIVASSSTPSTRRLLDSVVVLVPQRSIEPGGPGRAIAEK